MDGAPLSYVILITTSDIFTTITLPLRTDGIPGLLILEIKRSRGSAKIVVVSVVFIVLSGN